MTRLIRLVALLGCASALFGSQQLTDLLKQIFVEQAFKTESAPELDWLDGGAAYTTLEDSKAVSDAKEIVEYSTESGKREVLVTAKDLTPKGEDKPLSVDGYSFTKDKRKVLIFTNTKAVWRQNTRGDYWVLTPKTHTLTKLGGDVETSTMEFAKFSPDGKAVAYVRANDIYVQNLETLAIKRLTHDGSHTTINGTSDWVYEEELDVRDGFRWSPDGTRIAFWHFDSTGVGEYPLVDYTDSLYPTIRMIPYPKAGTTNSAVSVVVVNVDSDEAKGMGVPGDPRNNYIARMEWAADSGEIVVEQLNRLQNTADLYLCDVASGVARKIFEDQDKAWVDVNEVVPMGKDFVWLSERDGWRHAYLVRRDGAEPTLLTHGNFDVIGLAGVSEKTRTIYFTASPENATQSYLYRVSVDGGGEPMRITPAAETGFHRYIPSSDGAWAVHRYSRFDDPWRFELVRMADGKVVHTFTDNAEARKKVQPLLENRSEFLKVDIGGGVTLEGWMIKPKNFDPAKKYPVLVYVYGEPAAQTAVDEWTGSGELYHRALAEDGYIVVSFDNQGTPAPKGREWRKVIYGSVGPLAAEQQTEAIEALCKKRAYLDANRIAVWGWSGGGTNTLNLMFRSPDLYKVGTSVAPVPDQKLYDTIYQERYMGLPEDNPDGYKRGSAINFAVGLKGRLLLVHGTGDDNVHFQGSQMLINKFVELGKQFSFMEYPNRTHAIREGKGTTIHLYTLLSDFLERNLPAQE